MHPLTTKKALKLKITYVITRSDVMGGASVHLLDLAHGAQQMGHEIHILVGGHGIFQNRASEKKLRCTSLKNMTREINPIIDAAGFFELRKIIKKTNPDIVHLHSSKAGILGRLACRSLSIPVIFTAHGWAFTEGVSPRRRALYKAIERFMARFSDKIITVSNYDKKLAFEVGVGDETLITTVHNGMPESPIQPSPYKKNNTLRLIMVARFDAPKDHQMLLEALSDIKELDWSLELVGSGPLLASVQEQAKKLNLEEKIIFSGACSDVPDRLAKADIFLLISNWEGLPLTILEAMRAGLPVIASNVGGVSETIEQGTTGFLVGRSDKHELADAIKKLIQSEHLRAAMGRNGRKKFEEEFTFAEMLEKTLSIYSDVAYKKS